MRHGEGDQPTHPRPRPGTNDPLKGLMVSDAVFTPTDRLFLKDVQDELRRAREKFPENIHNLAALTEEVGELAQALIDHDMGKKTANQVYSEAIQVAAVAARIATEGSAEFIYDPQSLEKTF